MNNTISGLNSDKVEHRERMADYTFNQFGAAAAILVILVWSLASTWLHLATPGGADKTEMTYIGTLGIGLLMLTPLYWKRVRWNYVAGIFLILALFMGAGAATKNTPVHPPTPVEPSAPPCSSKPTMLGKVSSNNENFTI